MELSDLSKEFLRVTQRGDLNKLIDLSNKYKIDNWTIFRHDVSGDTPLHIATRKGYLDIVKYLCNNWPHLSFRINVVNNDMKCPLHDAAQFLHSNIVDFLIQQGASVDALKRSDWTPLMLACTKDGVDSINCIDSLLNAGADLTLRNKDGWTPLHVACRVGNINIIKLLLRENPECIAYTTNNGRTTLHIAAFHGHVNVINELITVRSDLLHACDSSGVTSLHEAVKSGNFDAFKHIINMGGDVKNVDITGQTILHIAASIGNIYVIDYILSSGLIDIHCKDNFGITPLAVTQRNKVDSNCIELLKKMSIEN